MFEIWQYDTCLVGKPKTSFNSVEIRCSRNKKLISFLKDFGLEDSSNSIKEKTFGILLRYINRYSKSFDGIIYSLNESINQIVEVISILNKTSWKALFQGCFGIEVQNMCFNSIYNRIICTQSDRSTVNINIFKKLQITIPQLNSNLQQFFCRRHDASNATKQIINYHLKKHIKQFNLDSIKHCIEISSIMSQYIRPINQSELQQSNKFYAFIETNDELEKKVFSML